MKKQIASACTVLALAGCAVAPDPARFAPLDQAAETHFNAKLIRNTDRESADAINARVAELLKAPLTADAAVQIALINNRGLQASFAELGVAEADLVQASRLPNPGFSFARLSRGDELEIERGLHFPLGRMLALPLISRMERQRFGEAQSRIAMEMASLAVAARKAYFNALAAEETVRYRRQVKEVAEISATLAERMVAAGNWNKLNEARQKGFHADAAVSLTRAETAASRSREELLRLLGLADRSGALNLPERLPDLPPALKDQPAIEQAALSQRLDIAAQKRALQAIADNLGLVRTTRFVNALELGVVHNSANFEAPQRGYEISIDIPLFDWGDAKVARAEAQYLAGAHRLAMTAMNAQSEVREAAGAHRAAFDIARQYRDEIVPARKRIADENLLRYNGMLIGVFDLLADARAQIGSVAGYIEALRDYWLAESDLQMAMLGRPTPSASGASTSTASTADTANH